MGIPGSLFSFVGHSEQIGGKRMGANLKYRLGGILCLIAGAGFGWWGIWQPLQAAHAHAAEVSYSTKIFILVPALLVFGLFFLIGGARWEYRDAVKQRPTAIGWALFAAVAVISALSFWWLQHIFDTLGYTSG